MNIFRILGWGVLGTVLAVAIGFYFGKPAQAADKRVVVIHVDDREITVSTNLETVGEVLDKAGVATSEYDAVEPSVDTAIRTAHFTVNIYRARPVTVVDGSKTYHVMSPYESPRLIAKSVGVKVYDEDEFLLDRIDSEILQTGTIGQRLVIDRALPVTINLYGNIIQHRTQAETVAELIKEAGINPKQDDQLSKPEDAKITSGMTLAVARFGTKIETKREVIPAPVKIIKDNNLPVGEQEIREAGQDGVRIVTYEITIKNGKPAGRKVLQKVIEKKPKQKVMVVGTFVDTSNAAGGVWAQLRACESGGDYTRNSGNGFYGAYQFMPSTFDAVAPPQYRGVRPDLAPPNVQDVAAQNLQKGSGWGQWPACAAKLGLL